MANATVAKPGAHADGKFVSYPIAANVKILAGWAVMVGRPGSADAGLAKPLDSAANAQQTHFFAGFAQEDLDNTGGAAGDDRIKVRRYGTVEDLVLSGLPANAEGSPVYLTDNQTATLAPAPTAWEIGYLVRRESATRAVVFYDVRSVPKLRAHPAQVATLAGHVALVYGAAGSGEISLTADKIEIDPDGAARNVDLPAEAASAGQTLYVTSLAGSAHDITIRNSAGSATVVVVSQGERSILWCDGVTWRGLVAATT